MTFRQHFEKHLFNHGLFEDQAKAVVDHYTASRAGEPMRDRMNDDIAGYPPQIMAGVQMGIHGAAVEWLESNKPNHWAMPVFKA
jgi:hypothetical protein